MYPAVDIYIYHLQAQRWPFGASTVNGGFPSQRASNAFFGDFPYASAWSEGLVIPIHKKNDKFDVDNHGGIIISSIIGKVFTKILTNRITKYMEKHKLWTINQCGFKAYYRTEDMICSS